MPYFFNKELFNPEHQGSQGKPLLNIPLSTELDDQFILQNNLHSKASYVQQVCDACDLLLAYLTSKPEIWLASGSEIYSAFSGQTRAC